MVPRQRLLRHQHNATDAPLRFGDCRFAPGFESANLSKNRRPQKGRSAPRLLIFLSRLLRMTRGLALQPEEEPTQVEIRSRGDAHLEIGALDHQVVPNRTGTGDVTSGCAGARPELRIVPAESSINTRRLSAGNLGFNCTTTFGSFDHFFRSRLATIRPRAVLGLRSSRSQRFTDPSSS
jgi:hypothetical protein